MWRVPPRVLVAALSIVLLLLASVGTLPSRSGGQGPGVWTSAAASLKAPYAIFNFKNTDSPVVDPSTGYLYIADLGYGRTTIYDPARSAVVGFLNGVAGTMILDPAAREIAVLQGDGMVFVSLATGAIVATVSGLAPGGWRRPVLALDTADDFIYAAYNFQASAYQGSIWLGSTLQVVSVRLHAGVASVEDLWFTQGMTYDPANGRIYAADVLGKIVAIDAKTSTVVGSGSGLDGPNQVSYNPGDGMLYIACWNGYYENGSTRWTESVSVVDPVSLQIVYQETGFPLGFDGPEYVIPDPGTGSVFVGTGSSIVQLGTGWEVDGLGYPGPLVFDPVNGHVYAAAGDGVLDLNPAARAMTVLGGDYSAPGALTYDSTRDRVYVANYAGTSLVVIDPATNRIVGHYGGFIQPASLTYDPLADELFVGNGLNSTISVIDVATNATVTMIRGVNPWAIYDNGSGNLFAGTPYGLLAISGRTNAVVMNLTRYGSLSPLAVDPTRGVMYALRVPTYWAVVPIYLLALRIADMSLIWNTTLTGTIVNAAGVDPLNGNLYVATWGGHIGVYAGATGAFVTNITGPFFPQSVLYDPANGYVYVGDDSSGTQLWVIDPTTNTIVQQLEPGFGPSAMLYDPLNQVIYAAGGGHFPGEGLVLAVPSLLYPSSAPSWLPWAEGVLALLLIAAVFVVFVQRRRRRPRRRWEGPRDGT